MRSVGSAVQRRYHGKVELGNDVYMVNERSTDVCLAGHNGLCEMRRRGSAG